MKPLSDSTGGAGGVIPPDDTLLLFVTSAAVAGRRFKGKQARRFYLGQLHVSLVNDLVEQGLNRGLAMVRADLVIEAIIAAMAGEW